MDQRPPFDLKDFNLPKINPKVIILAVVLLVIILSGYSFWFTVAQDEVGVVLRFGKYTRTVNPGLNFKLPLGIEQEYKVPVERQLKQEFGFPCKECGADIQGH
jgi:membrane protease subunit HflK